LNRRINPPVAALFRASGRNSGNAEIRTTKFQGKFAAKPETKTKAADCYWAGIAARRSLRVIATAETSTQDRRSSFPARRDRARLHFN
jgi:hypothetical protein